MIRILLVDDHTIFREGLKKILSENKDFVVAGEASNATEAIKKVREDGYDLVIIDIRLSGRDGLDVLRQLKSINPNLLFVVLTMLPEELYALRAIRAGAMAFVTKNQSARELLKAVRLVVQGKRYLSEQVAEKLARSFSERLAQDTHEKLSDREMEIMALLARGKTIKEIAQLLSLSPNTVSTYRQRILKKLNLRNIAELTYYALKEGMIY